MMAEPHQGKLFDCLMALNVTFNNISVISWRSVLLVEETEYPEKTTDLSQVIKVASILWLKC
jgi:hypothetical protein